MEYRDFYQVSDVPVAELLLDTENPRIRRGLDQRNCIERLLRRKKTFMNLLRDIAENGLSIEPIVISKNQEGKWVVRDGNRRVAALKLLNEPELCPDPDLRREIEQLAEKYRENMRTQIDCMASDNEEAILRYLELKHTGANEGVGQENWSALMKAVFNVNHGSSDQNKRAVQLIFWAEKQGIQIEDEFPVTNLTRMLSQRTLELIGFEVENDELRPIIDTDTAKRIVERIIHDLATQAIKVDDIFTPEQQLEYVTRVRNEIMPESYATSKRHSKDRIGGAVTPSGAEQFEHEHQTIGVLPPREIAPAQNLSTAGQTTQLRRGSARRPSWDRKCIFPGKKPGFHIPGEFTKACNITAELCKLNVQETPIAVALLLRTLIELSEAHYRTVNGLDKKDALHKNIAQAAEHMASKGYITEDQKDVILRRTRDAQDILHVTTLQKYVHSPDFHPTYQVLNTLWDEIGFFVAQCWRA